MADPSRARFPDFSGFARTHFSETVVSASPRQLVSAANLKLGIVYVKNLNNSAGSVVGLGTSTDNIDNSTVNGLLQANSLGLKPEVYLVGGSDVWAQTPAGNSVVAGWYI